jgi:peptidoglycan/xylan/chitin deacetylase (PgdA/CDA1 family)
MIKRLIKRTLASIVYYSGFIHILRLRGRDNAKIILYHSVNIHETSFLKGTDTWISRTLFDKQLKYLQKNYYIISLQELVESLKQGKIPSRSVVITFDDGFADNFHFAYPYLKQYRIPATIFLTTDCIENKKPIWIQELNFLINEQGVKNVIEALVKLNGNVTFFDFKKKNSTKEKMHKEIEEYLAYSESKEAKDKILEQLYEHFNVDRERIFAEKKIFLEWSQIKEMHTNGIRFGSHGASHTPFSVMSLNDQLDEIEKAKETIESNLRQDFLPFSYPFGQERDFTVDTKQLVLDTGHSCILTAMPTSIDVASSPYELGRIEVGNAPIQAMAFELELGVIKNLIMRKKKRPPRTTNE